MRSLATVPYLMRGAIVALVAIIAAGVLFGPAGLRHEPKSAEATTFNEIRKLLASDGETLDRFGYSVAVSGDTAVVGATGEDAGGSSAGAAYVLQRDAGGTDNWGEVKKLTASDAQTNDQFGLSVAISGDTAVVGAWAEDAAALTAGAAYVFQRDQGGADNWGEVNKLTASDAQVDDQFGWSVAVSGDTAVVGARREDDGGSNAGAVYVFQRDQGGTDNWGEVKKLTASGAHAGDEFGLSVAVSGETAVVGAVYEDAGGTWAGAAYVFRRDQGGGGKWGQVKKLHASDRQAFDFFGISVAVSGETTVVGAIAEDAGGNSAGAAYVFQRDEGGGANWGEVKKLTASDAEAGDQFGRSVAVSGDTAVVGANGKDPEGFVGGAAGAAYVFERDEGSQDNWGEVKKLTASDRQDGDQFGISVAVSGDTAVVGAYLEYFARGAAYVFDLLQPKPTVTPTPTNTPTATPTATATATNTPTTTNTPTPTITPTHTITPTPTITPTTTKQPDPGDTDGDGCSDQRENGPDETQGGQRDYKDPNDYYDVYGPGQSLTHDGVIDLPNDILGVIQHFSPSGAPPYDVRFDRGPQIGANVWNMGPPDGVIDLPNDILGVIQQYQHNCV